jgi:WD40 repeat protein/serine/threonine protein kinase
MPADPKRVRDLFLAAAELPAGDRAAYLSANVGDDDELQAAVERLLAAHEQPASLLDRPAPGVPTAEFKPINERPGTMVGPYKLMEQIGEGGFGLVFVAEQTEPVRRKVALKVIKPGMDSKQVIARFEAERQALAVMDHPNIARVLDAGATESGLPYFVMELVRGIPITDYCDQNQLTPNERLELFISVCHAIQHAHQKGIIHRDIKPSNVLVGSHDGKPVAKVIDFGVAKAISQDLTQRTIYTNFAQIIGTPLYMSPEQAEMSVLDIDTRSDIYSLGVLLYELLTGSTPLEKKRFASAAYDEIRRLIREDEPPKPSHRLSTCNTLPSVAASRRTEPAKLSRMLRGELDWVVMKALEKDRTRRYETANGLARDIQRYLNDEVVEARPPSAAYRVSKFLRRHKGQAIAASLVLLALLAGIAGTTWGLIAAKHQEQVALEQELIARQAAEEKEQARRAEAERVIERDGALLKEAERVKERDAALDNANHQLDNSNFLLAVAAYDNHDVSLARLRLDRIQAKHRGWEWHYLRRQSMGGIFTLYGHTGVVWGVAFSPDGTRIATGSIDQTAKVWDARTGTLQLELRGHTGGVPGVAFSPDGTRIVTSFDQTVKVWDARTGAPLLELKGHTGAVNSVAFSPDGTRIVTGSWDKTAKVWDARTGSPQLDLKEHKHWVLSVAFSPDGTRIVTGSADTTAKVWDARTGTAQLELSCAPYGVTSVAFSPDGTRIVTGGGAFVDGTAKVWDARTGAPLRELKGHRSMVYGVAFSPDGTRIVTSSADATANVWDARSGTLLRELKGHTATVWGVAFSPDGTRVVSGSADATVKVWDARTGMPQLELTGHTGRLSSVAFSSDGTRIVTGSADATAKVWDARTGTPRLELEGHTAAVWGVAFSPDGTRLVTGSDDQTAKLWDARSGTPQLELKGHTGKVWGVAFSPDGTRIVTGSWDHTARVWDARTGAPQLELKGHTAGVPGVAFSPDGTRLVTGSDDGTAKVWDAQTGAPLLELTGHTAAVWGVAFSPDGTRIVTGSWDFTAKVWNARTGAPQLDLKGHRSVVRGVAFSPDGTRLVTGGADGAASVWDAQTGTPLLELKGHTGSVNSVAFSQDGTRVVTGSADGTAKVWDVPAGPQLEGDQPLTAEERDYRLLHTRPNLWRYREGYEAARAAQDDFAARFFFNLLPPPEQQTVQAQDVARQEIIQAQATADREIAAGRTQDALVPLATLSTAKPDNAMLLMKLAALEAWFGRNKEFASTCHRALAATQDTTVAETAERVAKACCLLPSTDKAQLEAVLALARKAVRLWEGNQNRPWFELALGMAEYRSGDFARADAALVSLSTGAQNNGELTGTAAYYRAMSLFQQGRKDDARQLATVAAATMKPLPTDEQNPLAGDANTDDLILWLAYKEAQAMIEFDAAPTTP